MWLLGLHIIGLENFDKPLISTNCIYTHYKQPAKNWDFSKSSLNHSSDVTVINHEPQTEDCHKSPA